MIGKTISHYRILGQAGEGGMGVVYVAEDTVLGRRVAIKIPHAGHDESHYRARFLREARAVSKLRHRNIAAVHDFGETEEGQPFIVMELVSGQTLGDLLAGPGLSIARAVEVVRETAEALSEAHRCGVVHRDIKPSNIIIDERGEVKVLDFGLAKQLHEEFAGATGPDAQTLLSARTRSDVVIGTPLYLSPEQARGAKVDGRSDLFALGALLYECIAGRPAFSGSNVIEIGAQVLHFDPPPPSRFNPRVPSELDRLTLKALAKRAEDRFQSAEQFAAELERVRARLPDSDTTRTRRLATAENGHRSSALITMAETLRRPKFSPLTLGASLGALLVLIWLVTYLSRPPRHIPTPPVMALYAQGVDAMREGAYYKASGLLTEAVEKDKDFALAHARLAEAWMEMDFLERAKDEMLAANTLVPDFKVLSPEDALYLDAVRSTLQQGHAGAINDYQQIVALKPDQPQAHLDLGRAYERNNQSEKALQSYTEATTRDPSYAAAFVRLGILHARQNNAAGAVAAFDRAQKLYAERANKEGEAAVHYQRGRLFAGRPNEARAEFEQALTLAGETQNKYQQVQALQQLAQVQDDGERGLKIANSAIDLAQASGMNDQLANGYISIGNVFLKLGNYDEAEHNYNQALQLARNYKVPRLVAQALFQMGSLRVKQTRPEEAEQFVEQALEFYRQGGYRREADLSAMVIGRSKRQRGDYEGALKFFQEPLRLAEQASELGQVGNLHRECGGVLYAWGRYPQALTHFRESASAARLLHNSTLLTYSLLNQANVLWPLGHYDEATDILGQVTGADVQTLGVGPDALAFAYTTEADMALSRRHYPEAAAKAKQALVLLKDLKAPSKDLLAMINVDLGLSESFAGSHARGRALCEEAAQLADESTDPWTVSYAQLALAEVLLEDGDAAGALKASLRAQEIFARTGRADSEWRALVLAGRASRRAGDETGARAYLARAATSLSQFEQSLDADASGYMSRPDVQLLRAELGGQAVAAAR
ncbi:MAG: eukaryotic-like serine/threonine-protein kinase [Acidobacteriota bacterium]|jgi:tetratricopeptide (TPR) repeat protein/tRNA A-37 threonylcarbamoyl transferase component Bud32|nr:eukaryotic-like serine/threonine-protein kinase [Acidobacteriota bacterium]